MNLRRTGFREASLVVAACAIVFALVAVDVMRHGALVRLDHDVAAWWAAHRAEPWTTGVLAWTLLHDTVPLLIATGVVAVAGWARGERRWVALLAMAVPGVQGLNVGLKHLFQRARPALDDPVLALHTFSFPSGHVAGATVFYGVLAAWTLARHRRVPGEGGGVPPRHAAVVAACALAVAAVAFSRVYLGVHFVSDVVAGCAEGLAWGTACGAVLRPWGGGTSAVGRRAETPPPP